MPGLMILATAAAVGDIVVTCSSVRIEAVPGMVTKKQTNKKIYHNRKPLPIKQNMKNKEFYKASKATNLQIQFHILEAGM